MTGKWHLLFHMEAICRTQSIVKMRRFNLLKIKQLRFVYSEGFIFCVSQRLEGSPKQMQLSVLSTIGFGFWLISDLPISGWSGFPHFRFFFYNFQFRCQPAFDLVESAEWKVYSRLWYLNLNLVNQNETCLIDFLILEQTLTSGRLFYRAT